jgi:hypothetical protein
MVFAIKYYIAQVIEPIKNAKKQAYRFYNSCNVAGAYSWV